MEKIRLKGKVDLKPLLELIKTHYLERSRFNKDIFIDSFIMLVIKENPSITRPQLHELTKIPKTTLFDHIRRFILRGRIIKFPIASKRRGRPKVHYMLNPNFTCPKCGTPNNPLTDLCSSCKDKLP